MAELDESLLGRVMQLPFGQRVDLADRLLESIHPPSEDVDPEELHEAWLKELGTRAAESDSGVAGIPAEEVWNKLDVRKRTSASG